jgi:hypothetical protein
MIERCWIKGCGPLLRIIVVMPSGTRRAQL